MTKFHKVKTSNENSVISQCVVSTCNTDCFAIGHTKLSAKELASQAFIFFSAGFETSATTMTFCLYELALNPDIQDRLRNEIDTVLKKYGGSVTYEGIQEMKYLDKVISGKTFRIVQSKKLNTQIKFPEPDR
jgi:cytochrome P450 family 6